MGTNQERDLQTEGAFSLVDQTLSLTLNKSAGNVSIPGIDLSELIGDSMSKGPVFDGYRLIDSNQSTLQGIYLVWSVDPDLVGDATGTIYANSDLVETLDNSKVLSGTFRRGGNEQTMIAPITLRLSNGYVLGFRPVLTQLGQ